MGTLLRTDGYARTSREHEPADHAPILYHSELIRWMCRNCASPFLWVVEGVSLAQSLSTSSTIRVCRREHCAQT